MADNQSQWPAQYPRYSPPGGSPVPPPGYHPPAPGYQAPPAGYQVQPPGYPIGPGYPAQPAASHAAMRASSADRERAVDVLKAGFAEGRLTQDEYNDRMGRAYSARTYGELMALTADLPAGVLPAPGPSRPTRLRPPARTRWPSRPWCWAWPSSSPSG